jgi:hypothetical protein
MNPLPPVTGDLKDKPAELAETSMSALIGREGKQSEEAPSNVDTAEDSEARIEQKRCVL